MAEIYDLELTDKQRKLVDEYMIDLNKTRAFHAAGYHCSDPTKLAIRVNKTFKAAAVIAAIRQRQDENSVMAATMSPLDVMLENMKFWYDEAHKAGASMEVVAASRKMAQDCAKDAAPYIHPRLQHIAHMHRMKRSIDDFTDAELEVIALQSSVVAGAGDDVGPDGAAAEEAGT